MYQSRLHATNGIISVAVDALNGEILEFTRESTWDNVVKNHVRPAYSLFEGMIWRAQERVMFHVPRYRDILADESLKPVITVEQGEDSATVTLEYPYLMTGSGKLPCVGRGLCLGIQGPEQLQIGQSKRRDNAAQENHQAQQ